MTTRGKKRYEGKAKILFEGPGPGLLVQHFKDDATAFNSAKHAVIAGKGILNNRISAFLMKRISEFGIPTHYVKTLNMREQLVCDVEMFPLEVVVRNITAGSLCKRLGIEEGRRLPAPILEFYYKKDSLGDPMVTEEHIIAFDWASPAELQYLIETTLRINDFLGGLFAGAGLTLVDLKLEFGLLWKENEHPQIVLADEISPDNCRLWDTRTGEKLDKDVFRLDSGNLVEAYQNVARRLGIMTEGEALQTFGPDALKMPEEDATGTGG